MGSTVLLVGGHHSMNEQLGCVTRNRLHVRLAPSSESRTRGRQSSAACSEDNRSKEKGKPSPKVTRGVQLGIQIRRLKETEQPLTSSKGK